MPDFDPYLKWLGIPQDQQPPHAYRLLGIEVYESDPEVINNAADRQMIHLRSFQGGQHADDSQRLLNEISRARVTLLDSAQKEMLDEQLRQAETSDPPPQFGPAATPPIRSVPSVVPGEPAPAEAAETANIVLQPPRTAPGEATRRPPPVAPQRREKQPWVEILKVVVGGLVGLALAAGLLWGLGLGPFARSGDDGPDGTAGKQNDPDPTPDRPQNPVPSASNPFRQLAENDPLASGLAQAPFGIEAADPQTRPWFAGVKGTSDVTVQALQLAVDQAERGAQTLHDLHENSSTLTPQQSQEMAAEFYTAFQMLAKRLTLVEAPPAQKAGWTRRLLPWVRDILATPALADLVGNNAAAVVRRATTDTPGILTVGTVKKMQAVGALYRTEIENAGADKPLVAVYSWNDLASECPVGSRVMVLGVWVSNPSIQLGNYEGPDAQVIWCGQTFTHAGKAPGPRTVD